MTQVSVRSTRLFLLALLIAVPMSAFSQEPPASAQKWRQSQKSDAGRGITYVQFTLAGKFVKWPAKDAENRPTLEVDCRTPEETGGLMEKFWHAYFQAGIPLKIEYIEPPEIKGGISYLQKIAIRYRLDNGKEKKEDWEAGPDKNSVSIPKDALKKMIEAHNVVITVNEDKAGEVTAQLQMPDSGEVAQTCGLGHLKKIAATGRK
jgi:hypothetical protein